MLVGARTHNAKLGESRKKGKKRNEQPQDSLFGKGWRGEHLAGAIDRKCADSYAGNREQLLKHLLSPANKGTEQGGANKATTARLPVLSGTNTYVPYYGYSFLHGDGLNHNDNNCAANLIYG